jgi:hypothetical protein
MDGRICRAANLSTIGGLLLVCMNSRRASDLPNARIWQEGKWRTGCEYADLA